MDGWMDVRTDFPWILQDIIPFGSAALPTLLVCSLIGFQPYRMIESPFWAADPKGMMSCRTQGEPVCPGIHQSVRPSIRLSAFGRPGPGSERAGPDSVGPV